MRHIERRRFLKVLGWGSFFSTLALGTGGFVRFLYPSVLFERPTMFVAGRLDRVIPDPDASGFVVNEQWKESRSVWIVRERQRVYALYARCTHLGCTPNWFPEEGVFKCPCHGSRFRPDGTNFAGPAPRPLDRVWVGLDREGRLVVDTSRVYTFREFGKKGAYLEVRV